jgi:protein-S-isoprenylcysteine O-methyltransferase Ste14
MALVGEVLWVMGILAWCVVRYPFERRAKRVMVARSYRSRSDIAGLLAAFAGLGIIPGFHIATGIFGWADYPTHPAFVIFGTLLFGLGLWVFRRSHKDLGRNWSITLEIREQHQVVTKGLYSLIRHPMYTSFLLMGLAQACLLSNWVVGASGLLGFIIFFSLRVGKEERMMLQTFGDSYLDQMHKTKRIVPYLY